MTRRTRTGIALLVAAGLLATLFVLLTHWLRSHPIPFVAAPACGVAGSSYELSPEQAVNASTITSVALGRKLPERAITIALAAAMQESKLRNLDYGDADSVGLFQQRPSQGWGPAAMLKQPRYAAGRFFDVLVTVPGWRTRPLTTVAQAVQRSAYPDAYAQWEQTAHALSLALIGARPAMLGCNYPDPDHGTIAGARTGLLTDVAVTPTVAGNSLTVPVATGTGGWRVATWAVANGQHFGITEVHYAGQVWRHGSQNWKPDRLASSREVRIVLARPPKATG